MKGVCNMAVPVVKWAGGKRQLIPDITKRLPEQMGTYYEPFFGGGALFFNLSPKKAVINDFNSQLVNVYEQIKNNPDLVTDYLKILQDGYNTLADDKAKSAYYFEKRDAFNDFIKNNIFTAESASLFIFLNKAGFNGLYRVNASGLFNVPPAHRKKVSAYDAENITEVSKLLQKTKILQGDFEKACKGAKKGDLVFFDSPYYDTFDTYQAGGFSEEDHIRLSKLFKKLSDKGVYCILTNSETDFIKSLYKDYTVDVVPVKRMINCDGNKRTGTEVIITNF